MAQRTVSDDWNNAVAYFEVHTSQDGESFEDSGDHILIFPSDDPFFFGRAQNCRYQIPHPTVSNKHLRIHCIIYEQDEASGIPPLVYAEDLSTNGTYLSNTFPEHQNLTEERIDRKSGKILLRNGDCLRLGPLVALHYFSCRSASSKSSGLTRFQERETELFKDRYTITNQKIGAGGHGSVFVAIHKRSQRQVACKVIGRLPLHEDTFEEVVARKPLADVGNLRHGNAFLQDGIAKNKQQCLPQHKGRPIRDDYQFREFEILKDLSHPNIISLEKVIWSSDTLYIFTELVTGGDLFSFIEHKGGRLSDVDTAVIIRQVLKAIEYLHDRDMVHRDLKPDNILMTSREDGARVIVTDFGNARRLVEDRSDEDAAPVARRRLFTVVGTLEYVAPEVHKKNPTIHPKQGYSKAIDLWSIGAVTATMLSGEVIFTDQNELKYREDCEKGIVHMAAKCDLSVLDDAHSTWRTVGKRPKDFVKKLLVLNESERMTVKQALAHEWFSNHRVAADFEAVYQRAIADWEPRRKIFRIIEALDLSRLPPDSQKSALDTKTSKFFAPRKTPVNQVTPPPYSNPVCKRVHTPLPKIDEESTAWMQQLQEASIPRTDDDTQDDTKYGGNIHDIQNSMSQMILEAHSNPHNGSRQPSEANADILTSDREHNTVFNANVQFSSYPPGPPPRRPSSQDLSQDRLIPDTPPRKRKLSPPSDELEDDVFDLDDDQGYTLYAKKYQAKRTRVI